VLVVILKDLGWILRMRQNKGMRQKKLIHTKSWY